MNTAPRTSPQVVVPRIELAPDGAVRVVRWGTVLGQVLRPGDRMVPGGLDCKVVVLVPRGRGRPMLALRQGRRLLALPGLVPASPERWQVACGVAAVERDLERGAPGPQPVFVELRVESTTGDVFSGKVPPSLTGGSLAPSRLDALCIRAAIAPRQHGLSVALAAASSPEDARALLADTPVGCMRFAMATQDAGQSVAHGRVIHGPWPGSGEAPVVVPPSARPVQKQVQLSLGFDTRSSA